MKVSLGLNLVVTLCIVVCLFGFLVAGSLSVVAVMELAAFDENKLVTNLIVI